MICFPRERSVSVPVQQFRSRFSLAGSIHYSFASRACGSFDFFLLLWLLLSRAFVNYSLFVRRLQLHLFDAVASSWSAGPEFSPTLRHFGDYSSSELSEQQRLWLQEAYKYYASCYMHLCSTQGFVVPDRFGNLQTMFPVNMNPNFAADHMKNYLNHPPRNQDSSSSNNDNINDNNSNNNNINNNNVNINNNNNNNNNNLNINNNHVEEDLAMGNNRDWLDNFYTLSRVIVLFSIVYFYSSPIRFIIVVFLGFVIYLYQNGFFRTNPALFTENNNEPVDNNNRRNNNENQTPEERRPLEDAPASENDVPAQTRQNENDDRPGALSFTWIFFSSFFTSLVPDHPNIA